MDQNERRRLYREHILEQLQAECRDNPQDADLNARVEHTLQLHEEACLIAEEIRRLDLEIAILKAEIGEEDGSE